MKAPLRYEAMRLRLALVDDNPLDRLLAAEALHEVCPECGLEAYDSGRAALTQLRAAQTLPDVVLLDINMPGMNGFEVLQALKADPRLSLIPVVMLTTSSAAADVEQAYILHASSYVIKANGFNAFISQIEAFIGYWRLNRPAVVGR